MTELDAQMALLGTIDDVVCNAENPETVAMVERFWPGTTGIGQRGWYRELKHFLGSAELSARDPAGEPLARDGSATFPSYPEALRYLSREPTSLAVLSRSIFAATVLSIARELEGGKLPDGGQWDPSETVPDPLVELVPALAVEPGSDVEGLPEQLGSLKSRDDYLRFAATDLADSNLGELLIAGVPCTGALRKVGGKFCSILTTRWEAPLSLNRVKAYIDARNWPTLSRFFVSMTEQEPLEPDTSRGWTRLLEIVSTNEEVWQLRTALRFWNGWTIRDRGIYVNYDLDKPRCNDSSLVEVDAGYLWVTPMCPGDDDPNVLIRTCKQLRIRGLSPTATAVLACGLGWGDAMRDLFLNMKKEPTSEYPFQPSVEIPLPDLGRSGSPRHPVPGDGDADEEEARAAERVELMKGWRAAIIGAMAGELTNGIETAKVIGTDFATRWSDGDGFSLEDVKKFGADSGAAMTEYAVGVFESAAAALQPPPDDANVTGGNHR